MRVRDKLMRLVLGSMALLLALVHPVYAMATPSNATPGDATMGDAFYMAPVSLAQSVLSVGRALPFYVDNTVDLTGIYVSVWYYDMSNNFKAVHAWCDSNGNFSIPRPSDFASLDALAFNVAGKALPPSGKYQYSFSFSSHVGGFSYTGHGKLFIYKLLNNSTRKEVTGEFTYAQQSGDLSVPPIVVDISNITSMYFYVRTLDNKLSWPFGGVMSVRFVPSSADAEISNTNSSDTTADLSNISSGVSNISSGISNISSGISDMASAIEDLPSADEIGAAVASAMEPHYNNILTQLHHITEQLHAFWDQLAAYFNDKLIPQMIEDTDRIVEAIENIDIQVNVSMQELKDTLNKNHQEQLENDNKNHQEQLANDNKNADDIMNSYDHAEMDQVNDQLKDSLDEYESQESELIGSVDGYIKDFKYENPFDRFTRPLSDVSYFLTGIYVGLSAMNIPIAFSLTLSIALICIGWYRFRGG